MIVIGFFLLILILTPLRNWGAKKYLDRGDEKLVKLDYISAEIEYQKADILTPLNPNIDLKINLVKDSEKDINHLKGFFQEQDNRDALNNFKAISLENDPVKLTEMSRAFLDRNQPQMAVVSAQKAVSNKNMYRDGLLYLAIAYDRAARSTQIRQESHDYLINKSQEFYQQAVASDPSHFAEWK